MSDSSDQVVPPPPISFEELQDEARTVASKVLSRPQSGMEFVDDARTAIAMWADRLMKLLGPMTPDARVSSAKQRSSLVPQGKRSRPTRQRKVSRSAGPSLATLRKALLISGGGWLHSLLHYSEFVLELRAVSIKMRENSLCQLITDTDNNIIPSQKKANIELFNTQLDSWPLLDPF